MHLNLLVIRVSDLDRASTFYSIFGLPIARHRHGKGPEHLALEIPGAVFECYLLNEGEIPTTNIRLGFGVPSLDSILSEVENSGGKILQPAKDSEWGYRAVIADPFGHKIELLQTKSSPTQPRHII